MTTPADVSYSGLPGAPASVLTENGIEEAFLDRLDGLKYALRPDITDRAALGKNFREKLETLHGVHF